MVNPRATVIISTYNRSSVLPYSVGSVIDQSVKELQILVIGDGCTDDSGEVVEGLGDSRVEWINLPERSGHQSAPNNEGLRRAEAPVVFYLGHDDLWFPHHVEVLLSAIDGGADVAYGMLARVAGDGSIKLVPRARPYYAKASAVLPSGFAHRKSLVDKAGGWRDYRETEWSPEYDLLHRFFDTGARFKAVRRVTAMKFPAADRPGSYQSNDVGEQAEWLERIRNERTLEVEFLGKELERLESRYGPDPFRKELLRFGRMLIGRLAKKLRKPRLPREMIDRNKRIKGSD